MRVLDLGCGDGALTARLHEELEAAETRGIDSSAAMIAAAASWARPGLRFESGDIATFGTEQPFDLVFAHASLQWVPDHEALLPRLRDLLAPGGQIAVQLPANDAHITHIVADAIALEQPFASVLGDRTREADRVLAPERYAELLWELGCEERIVRLQIYPHVLPGPLTLLEWVRGTYLSAFEAQLGPQLFALPRGIRGAAERCGWRCATVLLRVPAHPRVGAVAVTAPSACPPERILGA